MKRLKIAVLTGAGMSAESGISTFRDSDGLWENHSIEEVASPQGFAENPELVLRFYNLRRRELLKVKPNKAHIDLAKLDAHHDVTIITQNIDDLHERAGSKRIIHLHGELLKVRSVFNSEKVYDWKADLKIGDLDEAGNQLRPFVVWFGEAVPMIEPAVEAISNVDLILVIGSSMQVYPAASLVSYAPVIAPVYYIDPNPKVNESLQSRKNISVIRKKATEGVAEVIEYLGLLPK